MVDWRPIAALILVGVVAIAGWVGATNWAPSAKTYPLQGVDLGLDAGDVEWRSVRAAGADFAYVVATAGADRRDGDFEQNWAALPEAGLRRGAVHLYSLCQPAAAQANAFNLVVPRSADALPAAVDVAFRDDCATRPGAGALASDLDRFVAMVEAHTGKPMLLRVSRAVERRYHLTNAVERPIWAVANFFPPAYAARPWRLWRASSIRRVDGIEGAVNWDVVAP